MTGTVVRRSLAAATVLALPLALAACAGGPPTVSPAGRDGLTIPTPSPDPADFVTGVDNPWFPLVQGTTWTYRVYGAEGRATERVRVLPGTTTIDGVTATGTRSTTSLPDGRVLSTIDR